MATIVRRKFSNGVSYQVQIRRAGMSAITKSFNNRTNAKRWARNMETKLDRGDYSDYSAASKVTMGDLFKRYIKSDAFGSFEDQEKPNNNNTKTKHAALIKDHRYMHSIGKINQKRIDDKIKKEKEKEQRQLQARVLRRGLSDPIRKERDYCYWTNPNIIGNYYNSIEEYEKSKKKKKFEPFY